MATEASAWPWRSASVTSVIADVAFALGAVTADSLGASTDGDEGTREDELARRQVSWRRARREATA